MILMIEAVDDEDILLLDRSIQDILYSYIHSPLIPKSTLTAILPKWPAFQNGS